MDVVTRVLMRSNNLRFRAIYLSLKQGFFPWNTFGRTYFQNLVYNFQYAWKWARYKETEEDREFEEDVNENFSK